MKQLFAFVLCVLTLLGCGAPSLGENVGSTTEAADGTGGDQTDPNAPVPAFDSMLVTMGLRFRAPAGGGPITTYPLTADVAHNSSDVSFIAVSRAAAGVANNGMFYTVSNPGHAKIVIQPTEFAALTTLLNTPGREVSVVFTYDINRKWVGQDKPIIGQTFSIRGVQPMQVVMHAAPGTRVPAGATFTTFNYSVEQPTYDFIKVVASTNGTVNESVDFFNTSSKTASLNMSFPNWTTMVTDLNKVGYNTQVMLWFDNSSPDPFNKELLGLPVFTSIPIP